MDNIPLVLSILGAGVWIVVLLLPWQPWRNDQTVESTPPLVCDLSELTFVIPARDEADHILETLASIRAQGQNPRIILIDDGSTDGTAKVAESAEGVNLEIIKGAPLPPGWSGKLWALEQGVRTVKTPYTLLLDADICLETGIVTALFEKMRLERLQFLSIMASLRMVSFWERLLIPAFIYFFKLIYPFRLANSPSRRFAAAAGGCVLLETQVIPAIGGFSSIQNQLIDDCSLARKVKLAGYKIWIGQSRSVISRRRYETLHPIWEMVARTAFTQLRYSSLLLAACVGLMAVVFWGPVFGLMSSKSSLVFFSGIASLGMVATFLPTLLYYRINPVWALLMPVTAGLYMAMTITSAMRYWRGERSRWKNRVYSVKR